MAKEAHVNWDQFQTSGNKAKPVAKGDKGGKDEDVRRGEVKRSALQKMRIDADMSANGRIIEYDSIINGILDGRISSKKGARLIREIWDDNQMYLLRGGVLSIDRIKALLKKMCQDGVITEEEQQGLIADALEEKKRIADAAPTIWDETVAAMPGAVREQSPTVKKKVSRQSPNDASKNISPNKEIVAQLEQLISEKWFHEESTKFLMKRLRSPSKSDTTIKSEADDIYQLFVEKILVKKDILSSYLQEVTNMRGYLKSILIRVTLDYFRAKKRHVFVDVDNDEEIIKKLEKQALDAHSPLVVEAKNSATAREILAHITSKDPETGFGYSLGKNGLRGLEFKRRILLLILSGKNALEAASIFAEEDPRFAERYMAGLTATSLHDPEREKLRNLIHQNYLRAINMVKTELGF